MSPRILFLFWDGVGLGPGGEDNPLDAPYPGLARLADGQRWTAEAVPLRESRRVFVPLDATLGVEGLPQSGTGQASLLTGENAARRHGRHFGPYPPTTVRPVVETRSVFARLVAAGVPAERLAFANAYPDRFFRHLEAGGRPTATTLAARSAGVRLRQRGDLEAGRALAADLTGETWRRLLDPAHRPISEAEAAGRLAALLDDHAFVLSEYFLTDKAGHSQDADRARVVLGSLDRLVAALLDRLDPQRDLLVLTSDHGNLEDLSVKTHTRNPVPLVALGPEADVFADARSLLDVTPRVVRLLAPR